jgi:L-asparagine transporter-like permease
MPVNRPTDKLQCQISLGEMVAYLPIPGGHIKLAERFVDPAFSFTMGWNYWCVNLACKYLLHFLTAVVSLKGITGRLSCLQSSVPLRSLLVTGIKRLILQSG